MLAVVKSMLPWPPPTSTRICACNDYWDHVDFVVRQAGALGLYVAFLPTWGDKWKVDRGIGPEIFTRENAETYGEWLGKRYKDKGLVWIVGGDRSVDSDEQKEIVRAMARGLRQGDGGAHLITFHPPGGAGSSKWFHDEEWLDFNMRQNGHVVEFTGRYDQTRSRLQSHPDKTGDRRRADLRRSPGFLQSEGARTLDRGRCAPPPLLGSLHRRVRAHLRASFGLADVEAGQGADQQSADAVVRGNRSARRGADAAWPPPDRVAPVSHPHPRRLIIVESNIPTAMPGTGAPFCGDPGRIRQLRDGLRACRPTLQSPDEQDHRSESEGMVVQPSRRNGDRDRRVCKHRRTRIHAAHPAKCSTGSSSSMTRRRISLHPVLAGRRQAQGWARGRSSDAAGAGVDLKGYTN